VPGAPDHPRNKSRDGGLPSGSCKKSAEGVFWAQDMLPHHQVVEVLSAASVFVCPSVYEPLGIVNLEAMACNTCGGGLRCGRYSQRFVVNDFTGTLVHYEESDPLSFEHDLAEAVTRYSWLIRRRRKPMVMQAESGQSTTSHGRKLPVRPVNCTNR